MYSLAAEKCIKLEIKLNQISLILPASTSKYTFILYLKLGRQWVLLDKYVGVAI